MGLYIGIDLGTSGCRAVAIDDDKVVIATYARSMSEPESDKPGHSEQDPDIWWQSLLQVLQGLLANISTNEGRRAIRGPGDNMGLFRQAEHASDVFVDRCNSGSRWIYPR